MNYPNKNTYKHVKTATKKKNTANIVVAGCKKQRAKRKKSRKSASQCLYVDILQQACVGTHTKIRYDLSEIKPRGFQCLGYINNVLVAEGLDKFKGRAARNNCANRIIDLILLKEIIVEDIIFENLSKRLPMPTPACISSLSVKVKASLDATKGKPLVPDPNDKDKPANKPMTSANKPASSQLTSRDTQPEYPKIPETIRKMGWSGDGLGPEGNKGIKEPVVLKTVHGKKIKISKSVKPRTQPIITRNFLETFMRGFDQEIMVKEQLIEEDYRLLAKLCKPRRLEYEFVGEDESQHLVIRKPSGWEKTTIGSRYLERRVNMFLKQMRNRHKSSHAGSKTTNPTSSATAGHTNIQGPSTIVEKNEGVSAMDTKNNNAPPASTNNCTRFVETSIEPGSLKITMKPNRKVFIAPSTGQQLKTEEVASSATKSLSNETLGVSLNRPLTQSRVENVTRKKPTYRGSYLWIKPLPSVVDATKPVEDTNKVLNAVFQTPTTGMSSVKVDKPVSIKE